MIGIKLLQKDKEDLVTAINNADRYLVGEVRDRIFGKTVLFVKPLEKESHKLLYYHLIGDLSDALLTERIISLYKDLTILHAGKVVTEALEYEHLALSMPSKVFQLYKNACIWEFKQDTESYVNDFILSASGLLCVKFMSQFYFPSSIRILNILCGIVDGTSKVTDLYDRSLIEAFVADSQVLITEDFYTV